MSDLKFEEKAKELVEKFYHLFKVDLEHSISIREAKACASILCDEILKEIMPKGARNGAERSREIYYQSLKQIINQQ